MSATFSQRARGFAAEASTMEITLNRAFAALIEIGNIATKAATSEEDTLSKEDAFGKIILLARDVVGSLV